MDQIVSWSSALITLGVILFGFGYIITQFKRGKNDGQKELDALDDRLIVRQKQAIESLEKRVSELEIQQELHKKEIDRLTTENVVVTKVLQGRDDQTQKFQTEGFKAMEVAHQIYELTIATSRNVERLAAAIEKHLEIMEKNKVIIHDK